MNFRFASLPAVMSLVVLTGCGTIDVTPAGSTTRAVAGTIRGDVPLPAGAEIVVRVIETANRAAASVGAEIPVGDRAPPVPVAAQRVLAEQTQTLAAATNEPVPFRIEFEADDATLRRGLNIDARVSTAGRVRFRTVNAHVLTLGSVPFPHEVLVEAVTR